MKRTNKKLLTLIFAGAFCAATIGGIGGLMGKTVSGYSPEAPKSYALTSVFSVNSSGAAISAKKMNEADTDQTAAFTYTGGGAVEFNRDLAFKWYSKKNDKGEGQVHYTNIDFAFDELNFNSVSFAIQTSPAEAIVGKYSTNTIKFVREGETVKAGVVYGSEEGEFTILEGVAAKQILSITLAESGNYGEFAVLVNGTEIGAMKNVGKNFADKSSMDTLVISADVAAEMSTTVYLSNLNGQRFDNIKDEAGSKMVADTAAPVLVINEEVTSLSLGSAFNLDYKKIDVLQSSNISETKKYYQYNPATTPVYTASLTTSTYFMDTVYYVNEAGEYSKVAKEGYTATSVYRENGAEYVSIQIKLGDDTYSGDHKVDYDLSWYIKPTEGEELFSQTWTEKNTDESGNEIDEEKTVYFIKVDRNENGPEYSYIKADAETSTNVVAERDLFDEAIAKYEEAVVKKAEKVFAGSNVDVQLPAIDWLIKDNNGYQNLKFTISYYKPDSTTASTSSSLDYDDLEISTTKAGSYEFKIFAKDKSGNGMKYYLDNELVEVTSSNVWDIEEIPSFKFSVKDGDISIKEGEDDDTLDTQIKNENYNFVDVTIVGASAKDSAYKLFIADVDAYNDAMNAKGDDRLTLKILSSIKYSTLQKYVASKKYSIEWRQGQYFDIYKEAYVQAMASKLGVESNETALKALRTVLKEVAKFDDRISQENEEAWNASDNRFGWTADSPNFTAAEEGLYVILADYWDTELAYYDRVVAYKVIEVAAEADVIKGETEWLKNNLVSVILFSVAGLMLVLIIILLLIKPSDETLEEIDEKAAKIQKATKKEKKND